jgi:1-acyl-sn-glycerol-3-phosphate acyltransferase
MKPDDTSVFRYKRVTRWGKAGALLCTWIIFFAGAVMLHVGIFLFGNRNRWRWISRFSRSFSLLCTTILNIKIQRQGKLDHLWEGGAVIVSNHMGYLDGIVLGALFPLIYVSKKEVRAWPIIGWWTALIGTIFVERGRKERTPLLVNETTKKLRQRANILVFPEGTSGSGDGLLPFQTVLFAAPLIARAPVVPVTLTYTRIDHEPASPANRDQIYWYGEMAFMSHFWNLLGLQTIEVSVTIHPKIETSRYANDSSGRKQLSRDCYEIIAESNLRHDKRSSPARCL